MYSQQPLNAPLGALAMPQTFMDFIFPDEMGNTEDSVLDEDMLAEIRAIARRSNRKITASKVSVAPPPDVTRTPSSQSLDDIIPALMQVLTSLSSSQSTTSTTASAYSSRQSLGSTGSQGLPHVIR